VTLAIVAVGFAVFYLAAKYLPIFEEQAEDGVVARASKEGSAVAAGT
jgi:hypothetical protein